MSNLGGGRRTPSVVGGSRLSIYSSGSTVRTVRTGRGSSKPSSRNKTKWYKRPLVSTAFYTDLQRGAWHIGFYTLFLGIWTTFTSAFDVYCLHEAAPGSSHTGYYVISFDFVYVGNPDVRNLLMMSSVFSMVGGAVVFAASCVLLDGLRKEDELAFKFWLWTMGIFAPWKIVAWAFAGIVNDMIFVYNVLMLIVWHVFNIINCFGWVCTYSLYLELKDLSKLQDFAKLKMETMSSIPASRGASTYGSRPTSPHNRPNPTYAQINPPPSSMPPSISVSGPSSHQDPIYATRGQMSSQCSDIY